VVIRGPSGKGAPRTSTGVFATRQHLSWLRAPSVPVGRRAFRMAHHGTNFWRHAAVRVSAPWRFFGEKSFFFVEPKKVGTWVA